MIEGSQYVLHHPLPRGAGCGSVAAGSRRLRRRGGRDRTAVQRRGGQRPPARALAAAAGHAVRVSLPDTCTTAALAPAFRRRRLEEVTTGLLAALLPPTGLLLVEDAHWLDDASADLVARFLDRLQDRFHWATCVTRRPGPTTLDLSKLDNVTHFELGPLVEGDAVEPGGRRGRGDSRRVRSASWSSEAAGTPVPPGARHRRGPGHHHRRAARHRRGRDRRPHRHAAPQ